MVSVQGIRLGPLRRPLQAARAYSPPVNFITIHYAYFIFTCLLFAIIFWGSSTPARSVSFTDSLFLVVSAMTLAGLNTVNLSVLNTFQQFLLFLLIMLGSAIFVSAFVVHVRRKAFENKFRDIVEERRNRRGRTFTMRSRLSFSRSQTRAAPDPFVEEEGKGATDRNGPGLEMLNANAAGSAEKPQDGTLSDEEDKDPESRHITSGITFSPETKFRDPQQNVAIKSEADQSAPPVSKSVDDTGSPVRRPHQRLPSNGSLSIQTAGAPVGSGISRQMSQVSGIGSTFMNPDNTPARKRHRLFSMQGVGALPNPGLHTVISQAAQGITEGIRSPTKQPTKPTHPWFPSAGYIARNSQFHGLSEEERDKLGGVEYRAVHFLSWVVPLYFVLWQLLGCLGLAAYVARNRPETARQNGLNPWWVGAFNSVSAFNNSGMSLLDANMTAFQTSIYMLITMSLLILAGNTCYPIFLRWIVAALLQLMPDTDRWRERRSTLRFLLDHPRRCYTNLFPAPHTWWLLLAVISLNGIDWAAFEILNVGNTTLNSALPANIRVIDGLFQAFAVRSGGFYVVSIPSLRISLQVLYVIMMYISVYPVVITMRNSNVYEERSLGIYADDPGFEDYERAEQAKRRRFFGGLKRHLTGRDLEGGKGYFVRQQLRAQLAHDAWWIVLAVFLIMIVEGGQFERDPATYSVFNFIFEIVSAYGCVGISVGLPNEAYSFCGGWHKLSKLILCAVMIRGRHRGLPVAIDKAVLLPGEGRASMEEEDAHIRLERALSRSRTQDWGQGQV
ncbi:hypothetical protein M8818_007598 [Zalaria obscura]|uniref:Uncharacterized protein n=1 Tax=Zalaria obscura TaxID=2024903 RepID=A0ACC3S5F9_9PEZI